MSPNSQTTHVGIEDKLVTFLDEDISVSDGIVVDVTIVRNPPRSPFRYYSEPARIGIEFNQIWKHFHRDILHP